MILEHLKWTCHRHHSKVIALFYSWKYYILNVFWELNKDAAKFICCFYDKYGIPEDGNDFNIPSPSCRTWMATWRWCAQCGVYAPNSLLDSLECWCTCVKTPADVAYQRVPCTLFGKCSNGQR